MSAPLADKLHSLFWLLMLRKNETKETLDDFSCMLKTELHKILFCKFLSYQVKYQLAIITKSVFIEGPED